MRDICMRDDLVDVRMSEMDVGNDAFAPVDAFVPVDAPVDAGPHDVCADGVPAVTSGMTLTAFLGRTVEVPEFEIIDDGTGPTLIPYSEPLALALDGREAWIASAKDNGMVTTDRSHDLLLWSVDDIFADTPTVTDLATPDYLSLNDVYSTDARLGPDGLSALFVRNNPETIPQLFYRIVDGTPLTDRSIRDSTDARFPGGAALIGGLMPEGAIALAVQDSDSVQTATSLFLIPGTATKSSGRNIELGGAWPTPLPLFGTEGALAALNTDTGRVQMLHFDGTGTMLPTSWAWGEEMHARAIDITNVPGMPNHFVLASLQDFGGAPCDHALLTHLVCPSMAACEVRERVQVSVESGTEELLITAVTTPLSNGFALVTRTSGAQVTWLDRSLQVVGSAQPLFAHTLSSSPTFFLKHLAIASSSAGFIALGLFRNVESGHANEARYARSGVLYVP